MWVAASERREGGGGELGELGEVDEQKTTPINFKQCQLRKRKRKRKLQAVSGTQMTQRRAALHSAKNDEWLHPLNLTFRAAPYIFKLEIQHFVFRSITQVYLIRKQIFLVLFCSSFLYF